MLPVDAPPDDVATRLELVLDGFLASLLENESQQRTMLRLSLEASPAERAELPLRQARAIPWIEEALQPLAPALSNGEIHRLAIAIRSATGIESFVWLTDVAGLSNSAAVDLLRWSAHALLERAMTEGM